MRKSKFKRTDFSGSDCTVLERTTPPPTRRMPLTWPKFRANEEAASARRWSRSGSTGSRTWMGLSDVADIVPLGINLTVQFARGVGGGRDFEFSPAPENGIALKGCS